MAIHIAETNTHNNFAKGRIRVQVISNHGVVLCYCDGEEADTEALYQMADDEGAEGLEIKKKSLKSGQEIWTVSSQNGAAIDEAV